MPPAGVGAPVALITNPLYYWSFECMNYALLCFCFKNKQQEEKCTKMFISGFQITL